MPGRAYNPKGFEPDFHGELSAVPKEVMDKYFEHVTKSRAQPKSFTYDEAQQYLKRGEGDVLGHYVYEMMYDIYAGMEDEILDGAIDTHLHIYPDYVPRSTDIIQLAIDASKAGYRAICCKDHFFNNTNGAWAAQWVVDDLVRRGELQRSCQVLGTNILAFSFHPDQINLIRKYPNLGGVFFPTMTGNMRGNRMAGPDLPILDAKGKLMPEVKECIKRMAQYKICVLTGHRSYPEHKAMVEYCHEVGGHILLTHSGASHHGPQNSSCGSPAQARELIKLGAFIEISIHWFIGAAAIWPLSDPPILTNWLKEMGPENIVMSTDLGQPTTVHPIEGYRVGIRMLAHAGISKADLKVMFQKNAVKALYLDEPVGKTEW